MTSHDGYNYNPATGTYIRRPSHPPPLPPKELEAGFITKETQHGFAELEGDSDVGRLSLDDKPPRRRKNKRRTAPTKRKLRILSLGNPLTTPPPHTPTNPTPPTDGGGIRGYSTLVIIGELMHQIFVQTHKGKGPKSPSDLPRPCDYFDIIGGTGTGGLIALMLGRMRMDVESCKEYYVELTRYVFITDKTLMGVPYGKTLFKASRLEDAIKHCVRESTRFDNAKIIPHSPPPVDRVPAVRTGSWRTHMRRRASSLEREERGRRGAPSHRVEGNADAPLLDSRPGACKTFVTAVYKGTSPNSSNPPALLRTYPSRGESVPSYNCTIWQAGRATSATLSAFKPITIGQDTFLDEGSGRYNPAQQVLEEAHINEYPDDTISVFISIGTGKRPDTPEKRSGWWEGITPFEDFVEARRKLMAKLDDCERVHRALIDPEDGGRPGLAKMGVAREDYYRFNVEVGVGEFALNEWNRLADVSTNTRRYLGQRETNKLVRECAAKMVAIEKATTSASASTSTSSSPSSSSLPEHDAVAELSAEIQKAEMEWASPQIDHEVHPSQRSFSPIEEVVQYPPEPPLYYDMPMPPPKPPKVGKPLYPEPGSPRHVEHPYYAIPGAGAPNPEIRVTSPTTVAGDDSDEERRRIGSGRRRRSRSGSHGGSSTGGRRR